MVGCGCRRGGGRVRRVRWPRSSPRTAAGDVGVLPHRPECCTLFCCALLCVSRFVGATLDARPGALESTGSGREPGRPRGQAAGAVDGQSPDGVAAAFAAATFTYDTALDRSPFDAQVRSAVYATPAFAAVLKQPLQQGGGAQWNTLATHHGYTTVALTANHDDGRPPDQLGAAARAYTVATTGHGDNAWSAPLDSQTMYVFLTRTGTATPWQASRVSFSGGS